MPNPIYVGKSAELSVMIGDMESRDFQERLIRLLIRYCVHKIRMQYCYVFLDQKTYSPKNIDPVSAWHRKRLPDMAGPVFLGMLDPGCRRVPGSKNRDARFGPRNRGPGARFFQYKNPAG
jgi:hypothetical protein